MNLNNVKKVDIAIGIPSYNEADSISNVVKNIDNGLQKHFKNKKSVIINIDNNSPDKTKEVFLKTKTRTPKIYISTPSGIKGKGRNLINFFAEFKKLKAEVGAVVDADLKSIIPDWIRCLIDPVFKGYDYLTPVYYRSKYNGTITNTFCYPLICGLLGKNIRQPIGGDFSFSRKMIEYWTLQKISLPAKGYGIDIFMTLSAIKSGLKLGQTNLGAKIHKPSALKLGNMFLEVSKTMFDFLEENKDLWQKEIKLIKPPLVSKIKNEVEFSEFTADMPGLKKMRKRIAFEIKNIRQKTKNNFPGYDFLEINNTDWIKIIHYLLNNYKQDKSIIKELRTFYFIRTSSFLKEVSDKTEKKSEKIIQRQAWQFFKQRKHFYV